MTTVGSLLNEEDVDLNATERTNLTDSLFTSIYSNIYYRDENKLQHGGL